MVEQCVDISYLDLEENVNTFCRNEHMNYVSPYELIFSNIKYQDELRKYKIWKELQKKLQMIQLHVMRHLQRLRNIWLIMLWQFHTEWVSAISLSADWILGKVSMPHSVFPTLVIRVRSYTIMHSPWMSLTLPQQSTSNCAETKCCRQSINLKL